VALALVVFAWLALRHVHESVFLEDQTDQLQNFEALVRVPAEALATGRLEPNALLGPAMSDTRPTARALGPVGAIAFGLPVALGLGIDGIHVVTSLLIACATAITFVVLLRIDQAFAWLWFWIFSATGLVWWNAGLLWVNTLLLPAGLLLMAVAASCLWQPRLLKIAWLILIAAFAVQVHLAAVVATPLVATIALVTAWRVLRRESGRPVFRPPPRRATLAVVVMTIAAFGPYLLAEGFSGFQNSRAMIGHLQQAAHDRPLALDTAEQTLLMATDPTHALTSLGLSNGIVITVGGSLAVFAVLSLWRRRTVPPGPTDARDARSVLLWLTVGALVIIAAQAVFFALMRRPLASYHYVTLPTPFYAVVPAAFLREALARPLQRRRALIALACACVVFLVWTGPSRADRAMAPAMWSYRNIVSAINDLCDGGAADIAEGDGFAAVMNPRHDGVLRYLMKRKFADCRYEPGSAVLIAASRDGRFDDWRVANGHRYRRDTVRYPGIALYRRAPVDQQDSTRSN
jgi:hypothetical protein